MLCRMLPYLATRMWWRCLSLSATPKRGIRPPCAMRLKTATLAFAQDNSTIISKQTSLHNSQPQQPLPMAFCRYGLGVHNHPSAVYISPKNTALACIIRCSPLEQSNPSNSNLHALQLKAGLLAAKTNKTPPPHQGCSPSKAFHRSLPWHLFQSFSKYILCVFASGPVVDSRRRAIIPS